MDINAAKKLFHCTFARPSAVASKLAEEPLVEVQRAASLYREKPSPTYTPVSQQSTFNNIAKVPASGNVDWQPMRTTAPPGGLVIEQRKNQASQIYLQVAEAKTRSQLVDVLV